MRDSDQIRAEISEVQARLETVGQDIQKKQQELAKLKESHVQLVESRIGRERLPKSIGKQRQSMLTLSLEIENLQIVKSKIEDSLADLKQELYRSEMYENAVQAYKQAEQQFVEQSDAVLVEFGELNRKMQSCRDSVEEFLQESGNPLETLKSLLNDPALSRLSLRDFFLGHITEAGPEDNATFVQELVQLYRDLSRKLPALTDVKDSWIALSNHFDFISRSAGSLIPRTVKYVSTEQKSVSPSPNRSRSVPVNPRNLAIHDAQKQRELDLMEWNRNKRSMSTT